jgi:putative membrane protein
MVTAQPRAEPPVLLAVVLVAVGVSAISPRSYGTWFLEIAPIAVAVPVLVLTYSRFRLTALTYRMLTASALLIALGAHYTYAEVPLGAWMQDWFGFSRNHYDRIGHVAQGVTAAVVVREVLSRLTPLRQRWWLFGVVTLVCLGISGGFEVIEALAGALSGQAGDAYLGTQGDQLDAQWDMVCALSGAIACQALLGKTHDNQLHLSPAQPDSRADARGTRPV